VDPGDVAIIPDPGYQAYLGGTVLAGGEPHIVPLRPEHDFLIPLDGAAGRGRARAKILYLNYPNNPTTAARRASTCERRSSSAAATGSCSPTTTPTPRSPSTATYPPSILEIDGAREVAIEFHSLSKTYNMTGWRVGWAAGGER
jgi:LL-diaminopimelate aminotransferase